MVANIGQDSFFRTGTSTILNIATPLTASFSAMSWGVETIMAPISLVNFNSRLAHGNVAHHPTEFVE
jgi:hypothetical protein